MWLCIAWPALFRPPVQMASTTCAWDPSRPSVSLRIKSSKSGWHKRDCRAIIGPAMRSSIVSI